MTKAPTLNDVARVAKVSRSLVSLVFQDSPKVSEASRKAVLKAADKLGYQPNESARRLKAQQTKTVGVILTDIHNPYYGEIFYGVEDAANLLNYKLLIGNSGFESDEQNVNENLIKKSQIETIRIIRSQMVDGLVCSSVRMSTQELQEASRKIPLVLIGHTPSALVKDFDVISNDEEHAANLVIEHLVKLGHKKIAHISGGTDEGPLKRSKAYAKAMKKFGLENSLNVLDGAWTQEAGYENAKVLLHQKSRPTAIFAGSDIIAMGVLAYAQEIGLNVPKDLSVVGYDNSLISKLKIANLTTIAEPLHEMGTIGFGILIDRIEKRVASKQIRNILVKPELIVRGSTGPIPKNQSRTR